MRIIITLLFCFLAQNAFAQTTDWQTLTTDDGEFSIKMPVDCYSYTYNKDGVTVAKNYTSNYHSLKEMHLLSCYYDRTLLNVEIYNYDGKEGALKALIDSNGEEGERRELAASKNFNGREYSVSNEHFFRTTRYVSSKKRIYVITLASRNKNSLLMKEFFDSQQFVDNPKSQTTARQENTVLISTLKSVEPEIVFEEQSNVTSQPKSSKSDKKSADDPAKKAMVVLMTPRPSFTKSAHRGGVHGDVRLRLTFGANAKVEKIAVLAPLDNGLLRNAAIMALRMKFLPAEYNDVPVTKTRIVEYGFNFY